MNFFTNFYTYYESLQDKFDAKKNKEVSYDGCLTFECISSKNQLIFPFIYYKSMVNNYFKNYLMSNHGEKEIAELLLPMMYIRDISHELISKIFARIYSQNTSFYPNMNEYLMKKKGKDYQTFIKVMFEGLANGSLQNANDKILYRGTKMSRTEINEIKKRFEKWKKDNDKTLPSFLLYSRTFLSFSKSEEKILKFLGKTDNKYYGVVFELNNNENLDNKFSSNADLEFISTYRKEKEVLFFPYTTFCLKDITKEDYKERKDCIIIKLDYLGKYEYVLEKFKKDENFQKSFIEDFNINTPTYSNEIIKSNLLELKKVEIKKQEESKNVNLVEEKLLNKIKIEIKVKIEEQKKDVNKIPDNSINDVVVIEANEQIKVEVKKEESKEIQKEENLQEYIKKEKQEKEKEKKEEEKKNNFCLTTFKLEQIEFIWNGKINDDNKKEGKGTEYDYDNNLIYEGTYENGFKKKGIEYYIKDIKKVENGKELITKIKKYKGEYKNGIKWDGILYGIKNEYKYTINSGNGFVKEFYENGCLLYEGELKNSLREGKGKLFDQCGRLVYEGELKQGMKDGNGKEYNENGDLIFEGIFIKGEKSKGDFKEYNDSCELIKEGVFLSKGNYKVTKTYKTIKSYENYLMNKDCLYIMTEKGKNTNQINTNKGNILIFEEYDRFGELVFIGEYKRGKK